MVAALTAAVLICTSGCSLGGTGEKNKNRSKKSDFPAGISSPFCIIFIANK